MTKSIETREAIEKYVNLAMARRRRAVSAEAKAQMQALEELLRDTIEGARPAPRVIQSPQAVSEGPKTSAEPARISLTPSTDVDAPPLVDAAPRPVVSTQVKMTKDDKAKTSDIKIDTSSAYTPSRAPMFLQSYYDETVVPAEVDDNERPKRAVDIGGGPLNLSRQVELFFGVAPGPQASTAPPRIAPSPSPTRRTSARRNESLQTPKASPTGDLGGPARAEAKPGSRSTGPQASVYLLDGTFARGFLPSFDARAKTLELTFDNGGRNSYPMNKIMAVFMRVQAGRAPTPAQGTPVRVRLVNDREILGVTPDYEPGGMALTVVPEPRRGTDRVWIPAWAVKAIEMDSLDG